MKKWSICLITYILIAISTGIVSAGEPNSGKEEAVVNTHILNLYHHIDFHNVNRLPLHVFQIAYYGYLNLTECGLLNNAKHILTVCDMDMPSTENRLWVIDLDKKTVLFNTLVAHGMGSGDDCAEAFSNTENSHQTSLGFYVTGATYQGDHGLSLRLNGVDKNYNDAALDRGIVVHGAEYVSEKFIAENQRLGRSWGCPALPVALSEPIINTIMDSTCLFIYYPDNDYLAQSCWLNRKACIDPQSTLYFDELQMEGKKRMDATSFLRGGRK